MTLAIREVQKSMKVLKNIDIWSPDLKASDDVLPPVLENYYKRLGRSAIIQKSRFHELISFMKADEVDKEIHEVLDEIHLTAKAATKKDAGI
jgi:hypothetical protein